MKTLRSIQKNFKLLFRSKESAYTIVFGPILIILLVSFAFLGASDDFSLSVGTYVPASTSYSERVIDGLNDRDYITSVYPDQESCIESTRGGKTHACIVFSEQEAGNGTLPVTFYLDMSRVNVAYKVVDDVSSALELQSESLRKQLASEALSRMTVASSLVRQEEDAAIDIGVRLQTIDIELGNAKAALGLLANLTIDTAPHTKLREYQQDLARNTDTVVGLSVAAIDKASNMMSRLEHNCGTCTDDMRQDVDELKSDLSDIQRQLKRISQETNPEQLARTQALLDETIKQLNDLQFRFVQDMTARAQLTGSVDRASADAVIGAEEMRALSVNLGEARQVLDGQSVNATTISSPVKTSFVSVAAADDHLSYTYPYLLILVVMFIGMLLASTLIVAEKTSRAAFRNFTTPTSDGYHISVSFLTAAIILVIEVIFILIISRALLASPLQLGSLSTIMLILIAIALFTFLGMIIGYLSSTQEAAMIASISIGSILLFVSNVIIPIEGMAAMVQSLTRLNPYVVISELLKKSIFFGVTVQEISRDLLLLAALCGVLFALTYWVRQRMKRKYFRQDEGLLGTHVAAPLQLGKIAVHNEFELLDALDHMTRFEFESAVTSEENLIAAWVERELRNKSLARKLKTTSKEKMIIRLDKYLKHHGRDIRR
jgi:ABC-type multidrug transport system permease subunit